MTREPRTRFLLLAATAAILSGCSSSHPPTSPVEGTVSLKNAKPLANATIQFVPVSDAGSYVANGTTDANGRFQLQTYFDSKRLNVGGAVPGKYKVVVTPYPHGQRIAQNYGSPRTTPLTVEVPESGLADVKLEVSTGP